MTLARGKRLRGSIENAFPKGGLARSKRGIDNLARVGYIVKNKYGERKDALYYSRDTLTLLP